MNLYTVEMFRDNQESSDIIKIDIVAYSRIEAMIQASAYVKTSEIAGQIKYIKASQVN